MILCTLQIRGFRNIKARNLYDRNAAATVLKIMDCTSWVDEAKMVLFSKHFSNLQLTFSRLGTFIRTLTYVSRRIQNLKFLRELGHIQEIFIT